MYNDLNANDRNNKNGDHNFNRNNSQNNFNNNHGNEEKPVDLTVKDNKGNILDFKKEWITIEADADLVTFTDNAGRYMADNELSASKIRSIFGEIKRIQVSGYEKNKSSFYLLRPKVAYAVGREKGEKKNSGRSKNINGLLLFRDLFEKASGHVTDAKSYQNFCNFMEALVAYHKANGGDK